MYRVLIALALTLYFSCGENDHGENESVTNVYAEGFRIKDLDSYAEITILSPWKNSNIQFKYCVGKEDMEEDGNYVVIKENPRSVICLSTTHIAYLAALGLTDRLVAVANGSFVYNKKVRKLLDKSFIADLGNESDLDLERIVDLNADIILAYAIDEGFMVNFEKLKRLGQKVVLISEYMESDPLGQTEWIKVYGTLFDKREVADSIFTAIETSYNSRKLKVNREENPSILCNIPWKEIWYVPGGNSFTARLISDAGGSYLWNSNTSEGSINLDFETVLIKGIDADIWINASNLSYLEQIEALDLKLTNFTAFKTGEVYAPVGRITEEGGNDFYESGSLNAHIVLSDLIKIFSRDTIGNMYYYKKLE